MSYEFVPKSEYQPVRVELETIIRKVQKLTQRNFTFQYQLVGSGKRHLITREKNGNKGFDFDYNLILNCNPGYYWEAESAKKVLMDAFDKAIAGTIYSHPEDSKTAITIKVKDNKKSGIKYSCDFAIIYYPELDDDEEPYFKYIRNAKKGGNGPYTWEIRKCSRNIDEKLIWLKNNVDDYWNQIRREYLKVKNANRDPDKHSFQLYYETINNLYNTYR